MLLVLHCQMLLRRQQCMLLVLRCCMLLVHLLEVDVGLRDAVGLRDTVAAWLRKCWLCWQQTWLRWSRVLQSPTCQISFHLVMMPILSQLSWRCKLSLPLVLFKQCWTSSLILVPPGDPKIWGGTEPRLKPTVATEAADNWTCQSQVN